MEQLPYLVRLDFVNVLRSYSIQVGFNFWKEKKLQEENIVIVGPWEFVLAQKFQDNLR